MTLVLHGYRFSVYRRIARLALEEKGLAYGHEEVNPFDPAMPADYLRLHPFGRVPTLIHDGFVLYETGAITRYVDRAFAGPSLQPADARAVGRMDQILSVVDSYAYWPLVRQVFAHGVFRPRTGGTGDEDEVRKGLDAAPKVLDALDKLAGDDRFLVGPSPSLADLHLGAMIAYFVLAPEGRTLLERWPRLAAWWARMAGRPSMLSTEPGLPVITS
ncbi:MAG: glutathione S-transferase family protein [Enhydrobacter sp.]|nr:MAG: glutathione S-transferase family protein [Enhydrobacter sp.]